MDPIPNTDSNSYRRRQAHSWFYSQGPRVNYDQHGNIIHGYDGDTPVVQNPATGQMQPSPSSRNVGATPYAQPQNNIGANHGAGKIRAGWGWGDSPQDASDEIKDRWGWNQPGDVAKAVAAGPKLAASDLHNDPTSPGATPNPATALDHNYMKPLGNDGPATATA